MKLIKLTLLSLVASALFLGCGKDDVTIDAPPSKVIIPATSLGRIATTTPMGITDVMARCGGKFYDDGGGTIIASGVCWSTSNNPTLEIEGIAFTSDSTTSETFISTLTNLQPSTTYYVRAYITNSMGTAYGFSKSFKTLAEVTLPVVLTSSASTITGNSAMVGANVVTPIGGEATARGVCYSTSENPTLDDLVVESGSGAGDFIATLSSLSNSTTYYARAFATNHKGTAYGNEITFTTLGAMVLPTISTSLVSAITKNSAMSGGSISSDGNGTITDRGVCWGLTNMPTIESNKLSSTTTGNDFSVSITGLTPSTTYFVRAYATNGAGTAYGQSVQFKTTENISIPELTTVVVTNLAQTKATCSAEITTDGNATVTSRGICWSTTSNPTISGSKMSAPSGSTSFALLITGLEASTTYYFRAYATNSVGTAYGSEVSVTTLNHVFEYTNQTGTGYIHKTTALDGSYDFQGVLHASNVVCTKVGVSVANISFKYKFGSLMGSPTRSGIFMWSKNSGDKKIYSILIRSKVYDLNGVFTGYYYDYSPGTSSTDGSWGWDTSGSPDWSKLFNDGNGGYATKEKAIEFYKSEFYLDEMQILEINGVKM